MYVYKRKYTLHPHRKPLHPLCFIVWLRATDLLGFCRWRLFQCLRRGTWNAGEARSIAYVLLDVKTSVPPIAKHVLGSTEKECTYFKSGE